MQIVRFFIWMAVMLEMDALQKKNDMKGWKVILDKLLEEASLIKERTEKAQCAFMHDKISDALEKNKNFWKEMRKLCYFHHPELTDFRSGQ